MTKIRFALPSSAGQKANATQKLRVIVEKRGHSSSFDTDICLSPTEWDEKNSMVINHPDRNRLNIEILTRLEKYERLLEEIPSSEMTAGQIRDFLKDPSSARKFYPRFVAYMSRCATAGTREMYEMCRVTLLKFDPRIRERSFSDIDYDWLRNYETFLSRTMGVNTRSIRLRCIRTVFNDAISDGVTDCYPFRRFKIRQEATRKRCLTLVQLRLLRDIPCSEFQKEYRDIFFLMLYLRGINAADLFQARKSDVVNGRLEYRRQKTHSLYSVKIEPEAMAIINRYHGEGEYLLSVMDRYSDYSNYLQHMNRALKSIGRPEGKKGKVLGPGMFPDLSTYWCRHTVATLAAELDTPIETISLMLGHTIGKATTLIYIKYDERKADEAMRRVIDYINEDIKK